MSQEKKRGECIPVVQQVIAIIWPSFLTAGVATVLTFAMIDPIDAVACGIVPDISRLGLYTISFFVFWGLTCASCLLTCYFQCSAKLINRTCGHKSD